RGLHRGPAAHAQYSLDGLLGGRMYNQPLTGNGAHQMMKLPLDRFQIREDIRVIVFQIIENRRARTVVDELAALVEKGAVVLVRLDHEERRTAQPGRDAEVLRDTADKESRAHAGMLKH